MLFVATSVALGTAGTPLEHSGTLEACRLLSSEERLGSEVSGTLLGIAYNVTQSIGSAPKWRLWNTLDLLRGRTRRTNSCVHAQLAPPHVLQIHPNRENLQA